MDSNNYIEAFTNHTVADNIFIRKNTTQLSNVDFNLHECSGFTLEKLDDVMLEFSNRCNKLSNIIENCNKKVQEFHEADIEQDKINILQEGIITNFKQKFRELYIWFVKQLQAFAKLFSNSFSRLSEIIVSKLKGYSSTDPIRVEIEWYRDSDLKILLNTDIINDIFNSINICNTSDGIPRDVDSTIHRDNIIHDVKLLIKMINNTSKFKKIKMYSSESEWFRSTISCASTCIKIRDTAKMISNNILEFTYKSNQILATLERDDPPNDLQTYNFDTTEWYINLCLSYLKTQEEALKELFKLAYNNSIKVLTVFKKYIDAKDAEKNLTDIQQLSLESYSYEIDNMFKQSHINENGELELYNISNTGGLDYD